MFSHSKPARKLCFEDVIVEPELNALTRANKTQRLEPKQIALLCLLAEHSGELVSRKVIADTIWPGVVVGEESLNRTIFALRNALGDDARNPKFIETIPRKGYLFLPKLIQNDSLEPKPVKSLATAGMISTCLAIGLLIAYGLYVYFNQHHIEVERITAITQKKGSEAAVSVNTANTAMLYTHAQAGATDLYFLDLTTLEETRLTTDNWVESTPHWLNDDTWLYLRCKLGTCELRRAASGKGLTALTEDNTKLIYHSGRKILDIAYSKHAGNSILVSEFVHPGKVDLLSIDLVTEEVIRLETLYKALPNTVYAPTFSEDGETLYFYSKVAERFVLMALHLVSGEFTELSTQFESISDLSLSTHSDNLLIAGKIDGIFGIWTLSKHTKNIFSIVQSSGGDKIRTLDFNPKSNTIYYENSHLETDVSMFSIKHKELSPLDALNSRTYEYRAIFNNSEDGIYFLSMQSGYMEIWKHDIVSKNTTQLSKLKAIEISMITLSNNGQYIAFSYTADQPYLATLNTKTGKLIAKKAIKHKMFPLSWSNDDQYIYISEHQEQINLYRYDATNLKSVLIKNSSGLFAQESSDAQYLYFVDYDEKTLVRHDLESANQTPVTDKITRLNHLLPGSVSIKEGQLHTYSIDTNRIIIYKQEIIDTDNTQDLGKRITKEVIPTSLSTYSTVTAISEDGQTLLISSLLPAEGDIMRLEVSTN